MSRPGARKVLLIGWDAADWKVIQPLLDAGRMPHLNRLIEGGVMGQLATLHPAYSPMLWTSIATGVRPFKHGVLGFVEPAPDGQSLLPVTNRSRKVKAVWNIFHQQDLRSLVVGWWPSHPAEPINGVMVSDFYARAVGPPEQPWPLPDGCVSPPELREVLADLRFNPNELGPEHVLPFIPRAAEIDQDKDPRLASCMKVLAEAVSIQAAATWLVQNRPWDFMAVYFDAIDHFCHGFMKYHPPRQDFIPERDFELYHGVVAAAYQFHDLMLGELLRLAGDDVTVVLVSDHGFHPDHLRPQFIPPEPAGPALEHRDFGILVLNGPGLKRDELLHGASVLDMTPTLLTLYGLPVGADMDGKPLVHAFVEPPPVRVIPSWEAVAGADGRLPGGQPLDPLAAPEVLQQLVELGYVEPPGADREEAVARAVRELRFNLALSYRDAGLDAEALEPLRALHAADPDEFRFALHRAWTCLALGRLTEMAEVLDDLRGRRRQVAEQAQARFSEWRDEARRRVAQRRAEGGPAEPEADPLDAEADVTEAPNHGPRQEPLLTRDERREVQRWRRLAVYYPQAVEFLTGQLKLAEGDYAAALDCWLRAEQGQTDRPGIYIQLGEAYLGLRRWDDAERSFRQVLALDPDNPHGHLGLCRSYLPRRQNRLAAECALQAVQRLHHYPLAHFCLGVALARLRRPDRAAQAFQVALALNPHFAEAHLHLARLYRRFLNQPERAQDHLRQARAMQSQAAPTEGPSAAPTPVAESLVTARELAASHLHMITSNGLAPLDAAPPRPAGRDEWITVVAGLPRSGTSMLMQMLHAGGLPVLVDEHRPADSDNPRGYYEYRPARNLRQDRQWLAAARGRAVKVVVQLLPHLPPEHAYRVLLIQRDLNEVLTSQQVMLERLGARKTPRSRAVLAREYRRQVHAVCDWLGRQPNIQTLLLSYHEVLAGPGRAAEGIDRFLGGGLLVERMAAAVDAALHRRKEG